MNNCAFQYAYTETGFMGRTKIVCDETSLTMEQAQALWEKYYRSAAQHIKAGDSVEMVIWQNMRSPHDYGDSLYYIQPHFESDGVQIWEARKTYMPEKF